MAKPLEDFLRRFFLPRSKNKNFNSFVKAFEIKSKSESTKPAGAKDSQNLLSLEVMEDLLAGVYWSSDKIATNKFNTQNKGAIYTYIAEDQSNKDYPAVIKVAYYSENATQVFADQELIYNQQLNDKFKAKYHCADRDSDLDRFEYQFANWFNPSYFPRFNFYLQNTTEKEFSVLKDQTGLTQSLATILYANIMQSILTQGENKGIDFKAESAKLFKDVSKVRFDKQYAHCKHHDDFAHNMSGVELKKLGASFQKRFSEFKLSAIDQKSFEALKNNDRLYSIATACVGVAIVATILSSALLTASIFSKNTLKPAQSLMKKALCASGFAAILSNVARTMIEGKLDRAEQVVIGEIADKLEVKINQNGLWG